MNLHRASATPEWATVPATEQNSWQRIAAKTGGVVTPGNILTMAGFGLAIAGLAALLAEHYWLGLAGLTAGRLLDIADGMAANFTGTKSPLGELLDASVDKLITLLTIIVLGVTGLVFWWVLLLLLLPHFVITIISAQAFVAGQRLHPSRAGKLSMALIWIAIVCLILAYAVSSSPIIELVSYILGGISVALGFIATLGYVRSNKN